MVLSNPSARADASDPALNRLLDKNSDESGGSSIAAAPPAPLLDNDVEEFIRTLQEHWQKSEPDRPAASPDDDGDSTIVDEAQERIADARDRRRRPRRTSRQSDRYAILKGIAAGGMGTIYRAHDRQLDREVALKVLSSGRDDSVMLSRFITEARVLAKLQHPGIPPVHEEGWLPDGRAFIAMKLVQGHTLSELLAARTDLKVDLVKYLGIFRQVCETVAFAHSQGVLHRDLKPDNVMVGEFGEVQVIDWGLAKWLGTRAQDSTAPTGTQPADSQSTDKPSNNDPPDRSDSPQVTINGGPIGTPAYMPPEQASGWQDQISQASDVFSLGAILCEILIGDPPFRDWGVREIREASHTAALTEVHDRLAASHADEVLRQLAIRCLQSNPTDRPQSAGEIVELLDAHLDSLQDRLWEMELAHTKEQEQRRRRRLSTALALCASLLIAIVSGGWALWSRQQADRHQRAVAVVVEALGEARQLRETALAHPLDDEQLWMAAGEAIERTTAMAQQVGDPQTTERVSQLAAVIREETQQAAADRAFIAGLDAATQPVAIAEIRDRIPATPPGPGRGPVGTSNGHRPPPHHSHGHHHRREGPPRHHGGRPHHARDGHPPGRPGPPPREDAIQDEVTLERYRATLVAYGLDPEAVTAESAARHLLTRPRVVREEAVNGLHRFLGLMTRSHVCPDQDREDRDLAWLLSVLADVDPDAERSRIRRLMSQEDHAALRQIAKDPELLEHPPTFIWLVSTQLQDEEASQALILDARLRYPGSLVINQQLGDIYTRLGNHEQAAATFLTVLAIQESAHICIRTALSLDREGYVEDAMAMCRNAIRLAPARSDGYPILARILHEDGRPDEAIHVALTGLPLFPDDSHPWQMLTRTLWGAQRQLGDDEAALQAYQAILDTEEVPVGLKDLARERVCEIEWLLER